MLMTLRIALRAITRNRLRAALTALGIIIGVAAVIAMVAIGQGASAMVQQQIAAMGEAVIFVMPGQIINGGVSTGAAARLTLTPDDAEAVARECSSVRAVTPVVRGIRDQMIYGDANWMPGEISGVSPDFLTIRNWQIAEGNFFTDHDVRSFSKVCVIGRTVADNLFKEISPIGEIVRVRSVPFKVIGVFEAKGANMMGYDQDDLVVAPWTTIKKRLSGSQFNNVDRLLVACKSNALVARGQAEISSVLRERHRLPANQPDDFSLRDLSELLRAQAQQTETMNKLLGGVALVSLGVGGTGVMNIMRVSVTERTREIGIRMAIGARGSDILRQFLLEAMLLSAIGGALGIALGVGVATIIAHSANWPIMYSPSTIVVAFGFSALVGVFFGFYPASKASRLDPIECLRYE